MKEPDSPPAPETPSAPPPAAGGSEPGTPLYHGRHPYYGEGYYGLASQLEAEETLFGQLTAARIVGVLMRRWLTLALGLALGLTGGWFYLSITPPVYEASATIEMSLRKPRIMNQQGAVIDDTRFSDSDDILNTRLSKLRSRAMYPLVVAQVRSNYPALNASGDALQRAVAGVTIDAVRRSRLVHVSAESDDPKLAAAVANGYAMAAEAFAFDENRAVSESAVAWLKAQAEQQRKVLEKADQAIVEFRGTNQIDALEGQKKTITSTLDEFNSAMVALQSEEAKGNDLLTALRGMEQTGVPGGALPESIPHAAEIASAMDRLQAAVAQRDALLTRYTAMHPEVQAQEKVVAGLREQVAAAIRRARDTAAANLALLRKQADSLAAKKQDAARQGAALDLKIVDVHMRLEQLERERSANDLSYRGILNRIEEARLAADENTASIKVDEKAHVPSSPVRPQPLRVIGLGLLLGLLGGLSLLVITDAIEDHITSAGDIERRLVLKVLALVPHVKHARRQALALISEQNSFSQVAEAFAGLRGLLESPQYRDVAKVILVASTVPEEGKTITACNLALAYAHSGLKTLLIDFDLRRPRIGRIFEAPASAESLMHVLHTNDCAAFDRLPLATQRANLDIVVSRVSNEISPAGLMGSPTVPTFVAWAQDRYDRVIIDSPPFGMVSDSIVLGSLAGCVIMVCRPDRSRVRQTRTAVRHFMEGGGRVIGVVVNDVDFGRNPYFSNYNYRHYGKDYSYRYAAAADAE